MQTHLQLEGEASGRDRLSIMIDGSEVWFSSVGNGNDVGVSTCRTPTLLPFLHRYDHYHQFTRLVPVLDEQSLLTNSRGSPEWNERRTLFVAKCLLRVAI